MATATPISRLSNLLLISVILSLGVLSKAFTVPPGKKSARVVSIKTEDPLLLSWPHRVFSCMVHSCRP